MHENTPESYFSDPIIKILPTPSCIFGSKNGNGKTINSFPFSVPKMEMIIVHDVTGFVAGNGIERVPQSVLFSDPRMELKGSPHFRIH
jgi:hypothetical protein